MSGARLAASFMDDFLAFRCIERFEDGSGFRVDVELRSGAFGADYPFFVELHPMMSFLLELAAIDNKLTGEALLKPTWESQFIQISAGRHGDIAVRGELMEHRERGQQLIFEFRSDQTCVREFLKQLRSEGFALDF